jgi:hypothetical protein
MKIREIISETVLTESILTMPMVVVDVQPAYSGSFDFEEELAQTLNKRTGKTLMYVNAEDTYTTEDTIDDIRYWWVEAGMDKDVAYNLEFFDKGYGNLREAIDNGASDRDIILVLREMFRQNVTDSRDLYDEDEQQWIEHFGEESAEWIGDGISIMDLNGYDKLKAMSPFLLCGGGREECLKEVMLLCSALNIKYKLVEKFVYG